MILSYDKLESYICLAEIASEIIDHLQKLYSEDGKLDHEVVQRYQELVTMQR